MNARMQNILCRALGVSVTYKIVTSIAVPLELNWHSLECLIIIFTFVSIS